MADEFDIKQCAQTTNHAPLGQTGSCMCGLKKYVIKTERPKVFDCAFCGNLPEPVADGADGAPPVNASPNEVFCATEGCPAFSNVVTLDRWNQRRNHEMEVAHIPKEEPIFVLRSRDALALKPVWVWVDLAERSRGMAGEKAPEEKVDSAVARANEMTQFQQKNGNKMPD